MSDEDAFQAAIDAAPDDRTVLLVFADWLDERDDPRGPGYRAMARRWMRPVYRHFEWQFWDEAEYPGSKEIDNIPSDWLTAMLAEDVDFGSDLGWVYLDTRRAIDDAAARAFARLPPERQAELLEGAVRV